MAIVVKADTFEVIGKWKLAIHDNTRLYQPWEKPYYVLSPGMSTTWRRGVPRGSEEEQGMVTGEARVANGEW